MPEGGTGVEFVVKAREAEPEKVLTVEPEIIAGQQVGSRLTFGSRHDLTVEFADGALMVDDIDMMLYIIPNEFLCYRGDDFVLKFILDSRKVQIDHRAASGQVNAHAFIAPCR